MTDEKHILEQFLQYCDWGWPLVPLNRVTPSGVCSCGKGKACPAAGKHPVFSGFLKQGSTDKDQIVKWWRQFNHPNFGVLTGGAEGQLGNFALDIDVKEQKDVNGNSLPNGLEQIQSLTSKYGELPLTVTAMTGNGGYHQYYKCPSGITIKSCVGWNGGPGLDIRSNDTLAVVPPSRNAGGIYTWDNDIDEGTGEVLVYRSPDKCDVAECPPWLLQLILTSSTRPEDYRTRFNTAAALLGAPEGEREWMIFRLASKLRAASVPEDWAKKLCLEAAQNCKPPYSEDEAMERVTRAYRNYQPNERRWKDSNLEKNSSRSVFLPAVSTAWIPPTPIQSEEEPTVFPTEVFPEWLKNFVEAISENIQIPSDCPGMLALSVLATAGARKFEIEIKDGWVEPVNLFTVSALPPGSRKSATFKDMTAPILAYQTEMRKLKESDIAIQKNRRGLLEKQRDSANKELLRKKAAGASSTEIDKLMARADQLSVDLERLKIDYLPILFESEDITPEMLVTRLFEQNGRLAILSPEGGIFDTIAGRYNPVGAIEPYLKAHAGDIIRVSRKGRDTEEILNPALTIGVTAQPDVLQGMAGSKEQFHAFSGRGLFARFLFSYPNSTIGERDVEPASVPLDVRIRYNQSIKNMLNLPYSNDSDDDAERPWVLHLSEDAYEVLKSFSQYIEELQGRGGKLFYINKWSGKLPGAVARISALLHVAANLNEDNPADLFIQAQTVENACVLGRYLIHHALRTFDLMTKDGSQDVALEILEWLKASPRDTFLYQEVIPVTRSGKGLLFKALELLRNNGYIKIASSDRSNPQYEVNPLWMKDYKPAPTQGELIADAVEDFKAAP